MEKSAKITLPVKTRMQSSDTHGDIYYKHSLWSKGGLSRLYPWVEFLFLGCTKRAVDVCLSCLGVQPHGCCASATIQFTYRAFRDAEIKFRNTLHRGYFYLMTEVAMLEQSKSLSQQRKQEDKRNGHLNLFKPLRYVCVQLGRWTLWEKVLIYIIETALPFPT